MKKGLFLIMLLFCSFSVFALDLEYNQLETTASYNLANKGFINQYSFRSDGDDETIFSSEVNSTTTGDFLLRLTDSKNPFYLVLYNNIEGQLLNISYTTGLSSSDNLLITNEINLTEKGTYYFEFISTNQGEVNEILLNLEGNNLYIVELIETHPKGFSYATGILITGIESIISFNLTIWKVVFYLAMIILTITSIVSLIGFFFWLLKKSEELRNRRRKAFKGGK